MIDYLKDFYDYFRNSIPTEYQSILDLCLYTIIIVFYSFFVWKFYKFLARREIIKLNLKQYNYSTHKHLSKFLAVVLYTLEYLIILPFLVLFWFATFSVFLIILSEQESVLQIMLITAAIIASIRITSYISQDLSREIAKIMPFVALATFLTNPSFFNVNKLLDRIYSIPQILNNIVIFVFFIFSVEFLLRGIYSISQLGASE